jgi:hypothetical protein
MVVSIRISDGEDPAAYTALGLVDTDSKEILGAVLCHWGPERRSKYMKEIGMEESDGPFPIHLDEDFKGINSIYVQKKSEVVFYDLEADKFLKIGEIDSLLPMNKAKEKLEVILQDYKDNK